MKGVKRYKVEAERPALTVANSTVLINPKELEFIKTIGVGSCGEVFEANWRGTRVAVKKIFRTLLHGSSLKEFQMESDILRYISYVLEYN